MIAKVYSAIPNGYNGSIVEVEGDILKSLPSFNIVGMANKTITEARERVRSAIINSNLFFPDKKVTINLAPAELAKDGSHLDLPIALTILTLSHQLLQTDLDNKLFVGELSLDGFTKPVRGIINIVEAAKQAGFSEIYIPRGNLGQASLVPGVSLIGATSLSELLLHLKGIKTITTPPSTHVRVKYTSPDTPTLDDVHGQTLAKRALTIAIAGHHNLLLSGPPGAGKTMLARVAANLLPPPTSAEQIEITKIHSLCSSSNQVFFTRPFRAPHHSASITSIIGGGSHITPGEISLAHHGILFLDELPEYPRNIIESLRQPLEDHSITITRANQRSTYPANFILIATMNPCPCGHLNDPHQECTCSPYQIEQYRKHLSGPILDRLDLTIHVEKVSNSDLIKSIQVNNTNTDTAVSSPRPSSQYTTNSVKNTQPYITEHTQASQLIQQALAVQSQRYANLPYHTNSAIPSQDISKHVKITPSGQKLLQQALDTFNLSARAYFKILKVSRTIADLSASNIVDIEHISEALSFRQIPS